MDVLYIMKPANTESSLYYSGLVISFGI